MISEFNIQFDCYAVCHGHSTTAWKPLCSLFWAFNRNIKKARKRLNGPLIG